MKLNLRKTNPTKFKFGTLIALTTLSHIISFIARGTQPSFYTWFNQWIPFEVFLAVASFGVVSWLFGSLFKEWIMIQASLLTMAIFYAAIDFSLLFQGFYNGAIMWAAGVFVVLITYYMPPVELVRGRK